MAKLGSEQEEIENFIADYIGQIRIMAGMTDLQIKVLVRQLMEEDPEWFDLLRGRFRRKQLKKTMELVKSIGADTSNVIQDLARKVA